ncbi:MAG TPA: CDGSH iron-sulfur domain-containing protein, partial [Actinomycetota bacterium]|nr:CDGSH iron-sulfur domain-containing protein [Actinomycetota bacterium]
TGFWNIDEGDLFIGPCEAQANGRFLDFGGELVNVVDRDSACAAIDMIVEQGEAPTAAHPDAHYAIFEGIRREFAAANVAAEASGVPFDPVRPVSSNPMTRFYDDTSGGTIIVDTLTHDAADLFNVAYDTMLLMLLRFFSHTDESDEELEFLSRATLRLMTSVLRPMGDALAKMPIDPEGAPGRTAGPGFGYNRDIHLLSHQHSAWVFFAERLWELATTATGLWQRAGAPTEIQEAAATLQDLSCGFARRLALSGPKSEEAKLAQFRALEGAQPSSIKASFNGPYLVTNVEHMENWLGEPIPTRPQMALCRCGCSKIKPLCDGTHAAIGFSGAKEADRVPDRRDTHEGAAITVFDNRGICAHSGLCTDSLAKVFRVRQDPFVDPNGAPVEAVIRAVRACPSGALGYAIAPPEGPSGPASRAPGPEPTRAGTILVSKDGPYRVTGGIPITEANGLPAPRDPDTTREHYSLCRCGQSKNKPFCNGAHWSVASFRDPPMATEPSLFAWAGGLPALRQLTAIFYDDLVDADPLIGPAFAGRTPGQAERTAAWLGAVMGGPEIVQVQGALPADGPGALIPEAVATLTEEQRASWLALLARAADLAGLPSEPEFRAAFFGYLDGASRAACAPAGGAGQEWARWRRWDWTPAGRPEQAAAEPAAAPGTGVDALPGADEPVSFEAHIKALFRPTDREHMEFAFDLWSYSDVAKHAQVILDRLRDGSMPCDGAWSADQVSVFERWVDAGTPA